MSGTRKGALKREAEKRRTRPPLSKLLKSMSRVNSKGCWIWQGGSQRYGYLDLDRKRWSAHVLSFKCFNGYVPKYTLHKCDVPLCVNPGHLYDGTNAQNREDFIDRHPRLAEKAANKQAIGMKRWWASMTDAKRKAFIKKRTRKQSFVSRQKISNGLLLAYKEGRR